MCGGADCMRTGKIMATVMAAVMVCGAAVQFTADSSGSVVTANAEEGEEFSDGTFLYTVYTDHVSVSMDGSLEGAEASDIVIPSSYKGLPVTEISSFAFQMNRNIVSLTIPDTVTYIGEYAFSYCDALKTVNAPDSLSDAGGSSFRETPWLEEQVKKSGFGLAGNVLIAADKEMTEAVIPDGVTAIAEDTFKGSEKLKKVTIPDSVRSVGRWAFSGCKNLESVHIGRSAATIREKAFFECSNLADITTDSTFTLVEADAFELTKWIDDRRSEDPLVILGGAVISGYTCSGDVVIPEGVTMIANSAFYQNSHMVRISDNELRFIDGEPCMIESVTIPDTVVSIGDSAFYLCGELRGIDIPDSVNYIGANAFEDCSKLAEVKLGSSLSEIRYYTFNGCDSLTELTLPSNIKYVEIGAFTSCENLAVATVLAPDCRFGTDNDITGSIVDIGWYLDTDLVVHWECNVLYRGYEGSTTQFSAEAKGAAFESLGAAPIALGDPNRDGKVDSKDASFILAEYSKLSTGAETEPLPTEIKNAADVNADGMLDAKDASAILGYYSYISTGGSGDMAAYMDKN